MRKICWRIVPFIALMSFINFLDRTAISFAGPNGMTQDLGMTASQFGFASGIFFIGYILLEIPSNLALQKFGARIWLARIMISWGIVSVLFTWVSSVSGLYWLRFLLGITEAGFFPGAILYLSSWAPASQRAKILALFYLAQPLTTVIGAPIASMLISAHGLFGLEGWRIMFFGVGAPAVLMGIVTLFYLPDAPKDARWLADEERGWIHGKLEAEKAAKSTNPDNHRVISALKNGRVWLLSLMYFGMVYGLYALAFFLPTIVSGFEAKFGAKLDIFDKGLIIAIPYLAATIALYVWSLDATKRGVQAWHIGLPTLIGAITIPVALLMTSPEATITVVTITACALFCVKPHFWALPSRFLSGAGAAAGIALINSIGNIAGFAAPYITGAVKDATGDYEIPMYIVGAIMLMSGVLAFIIGAKPRPPMVAAKN